jgi:hypothetical protein
VKPPREFYHPRPLDPKIASRKELFDGINAFVTWRRGWLVSIPGAREATLEC